jgi:hypothetical protein
MTRAYRLLSVLAMALFACGCAFLPEIARRPAVFNPYPQLSRVAVVEFFNSTPDDTIVDGFDVAVAYASELQAVPGFEVVPPDIVRPALRDLRLTPMHLRDPAKLRQLGELLGVDAIVLGVITEYSPYYPPRMGLKTNWYATNPSFHPIPPGYGLPWGTPAAEEIPDAVLFEAEMALAREQLKTQTPLPEDRDGALNGAQAVPASHEAPAMPQPQSTAEGAGGDGQVPTRAVGSNVNGITADLPPDWPDARGLIPPAPRAHRPAYVPSGRAVMSHIKVYNGHDGHFTAALRNYHFFRDDARFGGWQSYLQRSDDFIRFCCHLHIAEMLSLRGGSGESGLVCWWPQGR